jgi:oxygen-independent coproporphyrinogen-3 oxidase
MDLEIIKGEASTEVGSYFVANYPPFSVWAGEHVPSFFEALQTPRKAGSARLPPLGLYIHIPFCRKRCKFCYFRVYTDKNSSDVDRYLSALALEAQAYANRPALEGRQFEFVYFGGGTPSFLSADQLKRLIDRISEHWLWEKAREVTFECEPGTLKKSKLETIRVIGTTRLSLGVEHFDDEVLAIGGRAHRSSEIFAAYEWAREVGFPQINIDLIAGMVGDTEEKWRETVAKAMSLDADSVTIYQMEVPHNTLIAREAKQGHQATPVPSWATKRAWVDYAFREFEQAGYVVSSGYTLCKPDRAQGFVYRDSLWHGADLIGMGVASFGYLGGVHYQNADSWEEYVGRLENGELPIARALPITDKQRLIREMILQLKLGEILPSYFHEKFGADIRGEFAEAYDSLERDGFATAENDRIRLTRDGLLRVDSLLSRFFEPQFRNIRYT